MASTARDVLEQLLEEGGFVHRGRRSSGLIDAETAKTNATADLRYGHLFDTSVGDGPIIDLVYEVPGQTEDLPGNTSIYFKVLEEPLPGTITQLRRLVWNQGRSPTLWIVTQGSVLIYDSYARPQGNDHDKSHLLDELKHIGGQIKNLSEFHKKNFDTGDFWHGKYGKKIAQKQRVDAAMLADLSATERALIHEFAQSRHELPVSTYVSIAHALLGRAVFVSYLVGRELLDTGFFQRQYHCNSFKELLDDHEATYAFFGWLRKTFNGDLFPFQENEQSLVELPHLRIVKEFLSGTDMSSYSPHDAVAQRSLWPYNFGFIPIELISNIYEMFAHSRNPEAAEASSVHYTRLPLVELVLSLAMQKITHTARVLDPACGSGIFLVEAFRRLVWLRAKEYGRPLQRHELHEMLRSQIFGIDIDRDAVHVAAFSLYLALLELDPDPQPPAALKFPHLVYTDPPTYQMPNLYAQDFCNTEHIFNQSEPFVNKGFNLIIGNPPWTALKGKTALRDPDNPLSGRQWGLEYCIKNNIPDNKADQAFMVRVRDFVDTDTRVAFIIGSRVFYQQEDKSWLDTFLENNTVETVVNLSDLVGENILFGGNSSTRLPASAIVFRATAPAMDNKVMYITPKWFLSADKRDEIIISAQDIHYLPQKLLRKQSFLWKSAFRGSARDYRLLSRLHSFPSLDTVLFLAGVSHLAHRGITFGASEQKPTPPALLGNPFLASKSDARYRIDVTPLPLFNRPTIAKRSNTKVLQLPALVLWRSLQYEGPRTLENAGCPYVALAEDSNDRHHLVIDQMYYGIPSSASFPSLVYRLNAILNSDIAFYMAFMFGSLLGWGDRNLIEEGDWLQVRLPDSILNNDTDPLWTEILRREQWLRENWRPNLNARSPLGREVAQQQDKLEQAIFQLYDLSEQEIRLLEDTIQYSIEPILTRKLRVSSAFVTATTNNLQGYAKLMCTQLDGILHYGGLELTATIAEFDRSSPLRACRFTQNKLGSNEKVTIVRLNDIDDVMNQMARDLRVEIADHLYVQRSLRVYDGDGFWVIKAAEKRLWSASAALNDADAVVREHMETVIG